MCVYVIVLHLEGAGRLSLVYRPCCLDVEAIFLYLITITIQLILRNIGSSCNSITLGHLLRICQLVLSLPYVPSTVPSTKRGKLYCYDASII